MEPPTILQYGTELNNFMVGKNRTIKSKMMMRFDQSHLQVCGVGGLHRNITDGWQDLVGVDDAAQILWGDGDGELEDSFLLLVVSGWVSHC